LAEIPINHTQPAGHHYLTGAGAIQPTLWESSPGQVHAMLRTTAGLIFRSDSTDYGRTWCQAYPTPWPNNNSGIDLVQNEHHLYLILNPVSGNWAARYPLVVWQSGDNGLTFQPLITLEEVLDPDSPDWIKVKPEFSYPAAVVKGGRLYLSYTHLRRQIAYCEIDLQANQ
jgi:predicted neuraminidase